MNVSRLTVRDFGQVRNADVKFGDLTVLVGPQATGKSIFLQLLKLVIDSPSILAEFERFNIDWGKDIRSFLELYFGEGMSAIWDPIKGVKTVVQADGATVSRKSLTRPSNSKAVERVFHVPAQRVMSLRDGQTRTFTEYRSSDPFVLREFSERLHHLIQSEFGSRPELFPQKKRLRAELRELVDEHIFRGFGLQTSTTRYQQRVTLSHPRTGKSLPFLVWSSGQREFVPLLLGYYWLVPSSDDAKQRRDHLEWVVIEEPEMGLHPNAISAVFVLLLDLIRRGYRVCLSTHSPHVLDLVWALEVIRKHNGTYQDILELLALPLDSAYLRNLGRKGLALKARVFFFQSSGKVRDISGLDPGAPESAEAGWGGLTGFSAHVGDVVARVVNRSSKEAG
ncbi:MAG: AAA family ATPase [Gemmataceae bacterium]|nr:AAA family ATPase [Gemmataceae bacterium]MCI0743581.1 AAA family ATPase [Gemmataceae bacterium]